MIVCRAPWPGDPEAPARGYRLGLSADGAIVASLRQAAIGCKRDGSQQRDRLAAVGLDFGQGTIARLDKAVVPFGLVVIKPWACKASLDYPPTAHQGSACGGHSNG